MSSIDISQLTELLTNEVYPLVMNQYEETPTVFSELGMVEGYDPRYAYGKKGSVTTGLDLPEEVSDGQESPATTDETAYTWQLKVRPISRRVDIPRRVLEQGLAQAVDFAAEYTRNMGRNFALWKDQHIAGMFQKGTLTAGSAKYFDNSFAGNADPYPKFIYDGLPWFDGAHTLNASTATKSNINTSLALNTTNLEAVLNIIEATNAVDERGETILNPADTLLVPTSLRFTAQKLIESQRVPGGSNNDENVVRGSLRVIAWNQLTDDADAWWVGRSRAGLRIIDSGMPEMSTVYDPKTRTMSLIFDSYFGATVDDWRPWYAANKADS